MTSYAFSTFQIWACHMTNVEKLSETFMSHDTLSSYKKVNKHEVDTNISSRVIKIFVEIGLRDT